MKSEINKHLSGGGRLSFLLTFAIAFVLAMCTTSDALAQTYVSWTAWDASTSTLTLRSGKKGVSSVPTSSNQTEWLLDEADDGWQRRKYGTDYNNVYEFENGKSGIGNGIYKEVKKIVITDLYHDGYSPTSICNFFRDFVNLEEIVGLANIDTRKITTFYSCFKNCTKLKHVRGLEAWNTSSATEMNRMFCGCESLEGIDLSNFNTANVTDMSAMFYGCKNLKKIWVSSSGLNKNKLNNSRNMFYGCKKLTDKAYEDNTPWVNSTVAYVGTDGVLTVIPSASTAYAVLYKDNTLSFYYDRYYLGTKPDSDPDAYYYYTLNTVNQPDWIQDSKIKERIEKVSFDLSFVDYKPTTCYHWFHGCTNLTEIDLKYLNYSEVTSMNSMFNNCSSLKRVSFKDGVSFYYPRWSAANQQFTKKQESITFEASKCQYFDYMFCNCTALEYVDLSGSYSKDITCTTTHMFEGCSNLPSQVGKIVQYTTDASYMYAGCKKITTFNATCSKCTSFANMFENCTALESVNIVSTGANSCNLKNMFNNCSSLKSLNFSNSEKSVTDYVYFKPSFQISDMQYLFSGCSSIEKICLLYNNSTSDAPTYHFMFQNCSNLTTIYVLTSGFDFSSLARNGNKMFLGCTSLKGYQETQYDDSHRGYSYAHLDGGTDNPGYFSPYDNKITYNLNGGSFSGSAKEEYTVLDGTFTIATPKRNLYVFVGWTATGAITQTIPTTSLKVPQGTCGDIVLTANWKLDISKATIKLSSETYSGKIIPLIVTCNGKTLKEGTDFTQSKIVLYAGDHTITLTGKGDYASTKTVSLYVNKAPITVNIADITKEYGKTDPALTYTLSQDPLGSDIIEGTLKRAEGEDVGSYNIQTNDGFTNSNYDLTIKTGTFTITPIAATVTPDAGQEKTYGDEDPELTYSVDGLINSDKLTGALSRANGENVGSYAIEQGSLNNPNYTITIADGAVFTIKPKDVTVTPKANLSKEYGDPDPELEYEATLVGEDTFTGALSRDAGDEIGKYNITKGTLANDNYNINFTTGVEFEIKPKEINNPTIVLDPEIAIISGGKAEPTVKVYNSGKLIDESEYTFSYKDNTSETDNAEVTISASTNSHYNFTGTRTKTFKIINEAQAWKITYKDIDDNELKVTYVLKGTTTSAPQIIKEGYEIEGVYTEKACNTKWDFTQAIDEDKIFYIKWQIKTYDITYMIDGTKYEPTDANASTKNVEFGATINYPEPEARVGYTFSGWNPKPETMPDDDHFTVEGSFIINTHTITYTIDGKEYKKITVKYNDAISLEANPDEKLGYEFSQWKIDGYETLPTTMPDKDIAISGSYSPKKFKLVFNADGKAVKTIDYEFDKDITLAIPQEAHKSYKFTMPPTGKLMPAKDLTVDGRFEINKFNIVYMLDDETYATIPTEAGSTIVLIDKPTRDGYTFSNWQTTYTEMPDENITIKGSFSPNPHTIVYKEEGKELETVTTAFGKDVASTFPKKKGYKYVPSTDIPEEMPDEDLVIDGKFEIIDYTLTYYLDFEEYVVVTMHYGEQITPEPEPIRPGYQFSGWGEFPETMPDNNLSFFGTLEKLSYTITFMFDGKKTQEIHYAYGDAVKQPSMTSKTGYTFKWVDCPEYMPESNLTIEGAYIPNIYTITYMVCDTVYASAGIAYNTEIVPEEAPSLEGYTFSWGYIPEKMPDYDVTVTGKFTANGTTPVSTLPENANVVKVWSYNHTIYIETLPDTKYKITDINGRILTTSTTKSTHDEININQSGILIVIIGNQTFKVMN